MTIRVLIVDDSALMRDMLSMLLRSDPEINVVGTASDPYDAREKIKELNPDVLTLDVEMPRMDGITFLKNLMRLRPMPVVMVSSLIEAGADLTLTALSIGAVDFITKPKFDMAYGIEKSAAEIVEKIKFAAKANVKAYDPASHAELSAHNKILKESTTNIFSTTEKVIAIGASTGGVEAIREVITALPPDAAGTLIVQHMPQAYTASFAKRLNDQCATAVCEAQDGQQVLRGHVYLAPGGRHMELFRDGARYRIRLSDGPLVNHFKPSVDVLFKSVAQHAGKNAVGVILTGMGYDGAEGLREMRKSGAHTVAQDEKTSVVWGMPGKAIERKGACVVLPIDEIAGQIIEFLEGKIVHQPLKKRSNRPLYNRGSL